MCVLNDVSVGPGKAPSKQTPFSFPSICTYVLLYVYLVYVCVVNMNIYIYDVCPGACDGQKYSQF